MKCRLCETRKPRRFCPGVRGDICSICCGDKREVTVDCPLDCPYLAEARRHEKLADINPEEIPNRDVPISEDFLRAHEPLLVFLGAKILEAALATPGALDSDVREALDSLIRTHRTLQSGLYYETKPANPMAGTIHERIQQAVEILRKELAEKGAPALRDAEILGTLVFLQRVALGHNNGRPRGRAYLSYLFAHFPHQPQSASETPALIQV
ncbi:MAG TPA: hypothetical protein VMH05_20935 [Bryobacteraceae bacterium]|nr:hypothetical protein [Bryobacteraceae bacterium]